MGCPTKIGQTVFPFEESDSAKELGIIGEFQAGKDSLAGIILSFCIGFTRHAFGDFLKHEVAAGLPFAWTLEESLHWIETNKNNAIVRHLLQSWGMMRRSQDPAYFIKKLKRELDASPTRHAIITDIRFPNEAEFIRSRNGLLIKISRDIPRDPVSSEHPSEQWARYADADFHINNNGTLEELRDQTFRVMAAIDEKQRRVCR